MSRPPITEVGVIVPACDEETHIAACLTAIKVAASNTELPVRIVVIADTCTDGTAAAARRSGVAVIEIEGRNVGEARHAGARHLLGAGADPAHVWLASTDADTTVPVNWLNIQLGLAADGADAVLGIVELAEDAAPHLRRWHQDRYGRRFRGSAHSHIHGANLGLRGSAYLRAGGFPAVPNHEDRQLVRRLRADPDLLVISTTQLSVFTSARTDSRCSDGFAATLPSAGDPERFADPA